MPVVPLILLAIGSCLVSWIATGLVLRFLRRAQIMDIPNTRSNHTQPTPRGGGLAVTDTIALGMVLAMVYHGEQVARYYPVVIGLLVLGIISWLDDRTPLSARIRLLVQLASVAFAILTLFDGQLVFQGLLPAWLDHLCAGLLWVWFINLYNFMDGIDGITGCETLTITLGIIALGFVAPLPTAYVFIATLIAGATLGFLFWNWHPAKIFLGDVGSIPLGFILGWLLLALAAEGYWVEALILPAYYLADSTLTLLQRLLRGEIIWEAHSQHYYQRCTRAGHSHSAVVGRIACANLLLLGLAITSALAWLPAWAALIGAIMVTALLLYLLGHPCRLHLPRSTK